MPNWCFNHLEILGDPDAVARLTILVHVPSVPAREPGTDGPEDPGSPGVPENRLSFERVMPTPPDLLAGEGWYDWRVARWGTKWDTDRPEFEDLGCSAGVARVHYRFDTAWSPPLALVGALAAAFPELRFDLFYAEEGNCLAGRATFLDGDMADGEVGDTIEDCRRISADAGHPDMFAPWEDEDAEDAAAGPGEGDAA